MPLQPAGVELYLVQPRLFSQRMSVTLFLLDVFAAPPNNRSLGGQSFPVVLALLDMRVERLTEDREEIM